MEGYKFIFEALGRTPNIDGSRLMQETVKESGSKDSIGEDVASFSKRFVGREDNTAFEITAFLRCPVRYIRDFRGSNCKEA
jgi:hypothetical protein